MSYTKGPWKIEGHEKYSFAIYVGNEIETIAGIFTTNGKDGEANARLVAAAPELLEASKRALNLLCTSYENGIAQIKLENAGDIIGHLKEAIQKAEGA